MPTPAEIRDGTIQALQSRDDEIERLRAALTICASSFKSRPCTLSEGHEILAQEFQRRMDVAAAALTLRD